MPALKVLNYAITNNKENCLKFIEAGGLKFISPIVLGRGIPKICFSGKDGGAIKKDAEEAALSIFAQLDRCVEIFATAYANLKQTDQRILATSRALERAEDFDAMEEFTADIPSQVCSLLLLCSFIIVVNDFYFVVICTVSIHAVFYGYVYIYDV